MTPPEVSADAGRRGWSVPGWGVHLFTASGVIIALLAINAVVAERWREALLWLLLALLIDGVDGTLARAVEVKRRVPRIDGEALDLIVDYLNYVLVPTLLMWRAGLLPAGFELVLAGIIQLSSLYVFTRRDMKTDDGYFRGFPALWNVVALYLFVAQPEPWVSAVVVLALAMLTFAPVLFVHPFRSFDYGPWTLLVSAVWAATTAALLLVPADGGAVRLVLACSLGAALVLVLLGAVRTVRSRP